MKISVVENLKGTAGETCSCPGSGSWLEHWERKTGRIATSCAACSVKEDIVGAHVKMAGHDGSRYIVPLCNACNSRTDKFLVFEELADAACDRREVCHE